MKVNALWVGNVQVKNNVFLAPMAGYTDFAIRNCQLDLGVGTYFGGKMELREKMRLVQELVPGKQVTLCHIIANPDDILYTKLGLDPKTDYSRSAIGVLTISPAESAVIAADIAIKSSGAEIGFVDRFTGTLIISGSVSSVETAFAAIREYVINRLGYTCCEITKT